MSNEFQNVLAIDTALGGCSAGVCCGEKSLSRSEVMPRGQAQHLVPMVNTVMAEAGMAYDQLDAIITSVGPGAFTGLRIGMSTAKAFSQALGIPLYGVSTLQVLACGYHLSGAQDYPLGVVIETKRKDFYIQFFDEKAKPLGEPAALLAEEIDLLDLTQRAVFIGDGCVRLKKERSQFSYVEGYNLPDVDVMGKILRDNLDFAIVKDVAPIYLRDADVSLPKRQRRIQP